MRQAEYRVVLPLPGTALVVGVNVLAVEVHDANSVHADLRFDALVAWVPLSPPPPPTPTTPVAARPPLPHALPRLVPCPPAEAVVDVDGAQLPAPVTLLRGPYIQALASTRLTVRWRVSKVVPGHVVYRVQSQNDNSGARMHLLLSVLLSALPRELC